MMRSALAHWGLRLPPRVRACGGLLVAVACAMAIGVAPARGQSIFDNPGAPSKPPPSRPKPPAPDPVPAPPTPAPAPAPAPVPAEPAVPQPPGGAMRPVLPPEAGGVTPGLVS